MGVGGGMSGELSGVLNPPQPVVSISSLSLVLPRIWEIWQVDEKARNRSEKKSSK